MPQRSVFCIALSRGRAGRIVLDLKEARFSSTEISALFLDQNASFTRTTGTDASSQSGDPVIQTADVISGVMTWIAAVACRVIPGTEPIIAAGPIAAVLNSETVSGVADSLIDLGVPQVEAKLYEDRIKGGHILLSVHAEKENESERARQIFIAAGAEDICTLLEFPVPKAKPKGACGISGATFA